MCFFLQVVSFPELCVPHMEIMMCVWGEEGGMSVGKESGQGGFQGTVSKWHG